MKFGEVKKLKAGEMPIIPIRTDDGKPLYLTTGKCFSYGVKHDKEFDTKSMSLKLDDVTVKSLQAILAECGEHVGAPLTKRFFYDDKTIYPKLKPTSKLYEGVNEVSVSEYWTVCAT